MYCWDRSCTSHPHRCFADEKECESDEHHADCGREVYFAALVAEDVMGVVPGDPAATETKRSALRDQRGERAVPVREWMTKERQRILERDMIEPVQVMYAESMRLSEWWAREFREFWGLPDDFEFDVPTPTVDLTKALLAQQDQAAAPRLTCTQLSDSDLIWPIYATTPRHRRMSAPAQAFLREVLRAAPPREDTLREDPALAGDLQIR